MKRSNDESCVCLPELLIVTLNLVFVLQRCNGVFDVTTDDEQAGYAEFKVADMKSRFIQA